MAYDRAGPDGDDENRTNGEEGLGRRWDSILHIGWKLTSFQKQRLRQHWCFSVELTGTYTSTDVLTLC
jgi:hypothetical protein